MIYSVEARAETISQTIFKALHFVESQSLKYQVIWTLRKKFYSKFDVHHHDMSFFFFNEETDKYTMWTLTIQFLQDHILPVLIVVLAVVFVI